MHVLKKTLPVWGWSPIGIVLPVLALWLTIGWTPAFAQSVERHPAAIDELCKIEGCGLRNAYRVCDGIYRGGRLTPEGAEQLKALGVKTVISFRILGNDERFIRCAGLDYCHIPFKAWRPNDQPVVEFLRIVTDKNCQPVYFCCNHGSDRTGMMCAMYRMVVCGWTREEALCEMTEGPFGYHPIWKKVLAYVECVDVDHIKRQANLAE